MEDVIFAGTEIRKPMGFASVSIYFDNADRSLNMPYDEVVVSRRVYRSGESEYKINGAACRLKDIEELFYDTGVGQEGYSIIGQGRIDRILSGKKDDKRELFEEAASIVTFKKRKEKAIKELKAEEENLTDDTELVSVITAAIAAYEGKETVDNGLVVRSIKRVSNRNWN